MNAQKGDILFDYGQGFVNNTIEILTKGASHTCVIVDDSRVIEAQGFREVDYCSLAYYDSSRYRIYRLPNSQDNIDAGIQWLTQQLGRHYDYWDIFVLLIKCLFQITLPWKEGKRIICSRLVRDFLFQSKWDIPDTNMRPKDVEDWIISNGGVCIQVSQNLV